MSDEQEVRAWQGYADAEYAIMKHYLRLKQWIHSNPKPETLDNEFQRFRVGLQQGLRSHAISPSVAADLYVDARLEADSSLADPLIRLVDMAIGQAQIIDDPKEGLTTDPMMRIPLQNAIIQAYGEHPHYPEIANEPASRFVPECYEPTQLSEFVVKYHPQRHFEWNAKDLAISPAPQTVANPYKMTIQELEFNKATNPAEVRLLAALQKMVTEKAEPGSWAADEKAQKQRKEVLAREVRAALDGDACRPIIVANIYQALRDDVAVGNSPDAAIALHAMETIFVRRLTAAQGSDTFRDAMKEAFDTRRLDLPELFEKSPEALKELQKSNKGIG